MESVLDTMTCDKCQLKCCPFLDLFIYLIFVSNTLSKCSLPPCSSYPGPIHDTKILGLFGASQVAQIVKYLPAVREAWIWSLGPEDPLEKGMATHSSILAWRIPWTEGPVGYSPWGHKQWDMTEQLTVSHFHKWFHVVYLSLSDLTSLSIVSRSIRIAANGIISFFLWLSSHSLFLMDKIYYLYYIN